LVDGFEGSRVWDIAPWVSTAESATYCEAPGDREGTALRCDFHNAQPERRRSKGKCPVEWNGIASFVCNRQLDLSGAPCIELDVFNAASHRDELQLSVGVVTGFEDEHFETAHRWAGRCNRWKRLRFRIDSRLKTRRSTWTNCEKLRSPSRVSRLVLSVWGGDGPVWIDNVRVIGGGGASPPPPRPKGEALTIAELCKGGRTSKSLRRRWSSPLTMTAIRKSERAALGPVVTLDLPVLPEGCGVTEEAELVCEGRFDLSHVDRFMLDVQNESETPATLALRIAVGEARKVWKTPQSFLPPESTRSLEFSLSAGNLMNEGTGWLPAADIEQTCKEDVREIGVILSRPEGVRARATVRITDMLAVRSDGARPEPGAARCRREASAAPGPLKAVPVEVRKRPLGGSDEKARWEPVEVVFRVCDERGNALNGERAAAEASFTGPDGNKLTAPAFCCLTDAGWPAAEPPKRARGPVWKVRFTPTEVGSWAYRVRATAQDQSTSFEGTFQCESVGEAGFVRARGATFEHLSRRPFYPIGVNLPWLKMASSAGYREHIQALRKRGVNLVRIWNAQWGALIEWSPPRGDGLGRYSDCDASAFDAILESAEQEGVFVMLVLNHHRMFRRQDGWEENPYSAACGGPCEEPDEFFTSQEARRHFERRLRYCVARWGYSPNLFCWELFNEVDLAHYREPRSAFLNEVSQWVGSAAQHLSGCDPYRHLVSISVETEEAGRLLAPKVDFLQSHLYTSRPEGPILGLARGHRELAKPFLVTEIGAPKPPGRKERFRSGVEKDALHLGLWASVMSGCAGTAMPWWWKEFLEEKVKDCPSNVTIEDLYSRSTAARDLAAVSQFLRSVPFVGDLTHDLTVTACETSHSRPQRGDLVVSFSLGWEPQAPEVHPLKRQYWPPDFLLSKYLRGRTVVTSNVPDAQQRETHSPPVRLSVGEAWQGRVSLRLLEAESEKVSVQMVNETSERKVLSYTVEAGERDPRDPIPLELPVSGILNADGNSTLALRNTGKDWARVSTLTFSDFAPRFQVMGRTDGGGGIAWIKDRRSQGETIRDCALTVAGIQPGTYRVRFFDPIGGGWLPRESEAVARQDGSMTIALPGFAGELACSFDGTRDSK